jgi:hypothetical protein
MKTKVEQKINKKSNNEQNKRTIIINLHDYNWHMNTMHNINKSGVSLLKTGLNVTFQTLHRVEKYPCDYGTDNYNPI